MKFKNWLLGGSKFIRGLPRISILLLPVLNGATSGTVSGAVIVDILLLLGIMFLYFKYVTRKQKDSKSDIRRV